MASQKTIIWVHGTSGAIQPPDYNHPCDWGRAEYHGWGLDLIGNVIDTPGSNGLNMWDPNTNREPWVQFHIPTPTPGPWEGLEKKKGVLLSEVIFVFGTDCNPASAPPIHVKSYPDRRFFVDAGGAMVKQVHIYDGDNKIKGVDELDGWQSSNFNTDTAKVFALDPPRNVFFGVGVSVRLWFKNQWCTKQEANIFGNWEPTPGWNGQPFMMEDVTAPTSSTKRASIISVGGVFLITP